MTSPKHEEHIRHTFDSFSKTVLKNEARNCQREARYRKEHEMSFAEISEEEIGKLAICDEYPSNFTHFDVHGHIVAVGDEALAEAIAALSSDKRDIVLLAYFLDMTDKEIADRLGKVRSTVQYRRKISLAELKQILKGDDSNDD